MKELPHFGVYISSALFISGNYILVVVKNIILKIY